MGCDIHMTVERQVHDKWVCVDTMGSHHDRWERDKGSIAGFSSPVATGRNYERFAQLAGVRGDGPEPRGIPDDVSETTQVLIDDWGMDGHSHSWLPLEEAAKIFVRTEHHATTEEMNPDAYWRKYPSSYYFNVDGERLKEDEYRIVFWFDN